MYIFQSKRRPVVSFIKTTCGLLIGIAIASPALAFDARSIALGGSVIANGHGMHGVIENPATLVRLQREQQGTYILLNASGDIRDPIDLISLANDNKDLPRDIENEIDRVSGQTIICGVLPQNDDVCLTGTALLGSQASQVIRVFDAVDGQPISARGTANVGFAYTDSKIPFGVFLGNTLTATGFTSISNLDRVYTESLANALSDDELTYGEIIQNANLTTTNNVLEIAPPENVLQTNVSGGSLLRFHLGASFGVTLPLNGINIDLGFAPRVSWIEAANVQTSIADQFDDTARTLGEQYDDSENDQTSFSFDAGMITPIGETGIRIAAVVRNAVPETIESQDGYKFETTPQFIVGGAWQRGNLSINADFAVNEGKYDNFVTKPISLGVELGTQKFALRGGISADASRDDDETAISLGAGLGPLQIGGRLTGSDSLQLGLQLSFGF